MLNLFVGLKYIIKPQNITTESPVFRLHCQWTVLFLVCTCLLLTCRENFGDPIECIQKDVARIRVVETFCWIHATYIMPDKWNATVGSVVPHPGIGTYIPGGNRVYHAYYQWVAMVLFFQAILFYAPRYLWKCWEKGTMEALCLNLQDPLLPTKKVEESVQLLVQTLSSHWGNFGPYLRSYYTCEALTLLNLAFQLVFMDIFFAGTFTSMGIKVLKWQDWDQEHRTDPLVQTFPRMTKCEFFEFGSSGDVQKRDALCLLPLNILNEKIYIFLWFWLLLLCCVTAAVLIYRIALAKLPVLRYCVLVPRASMANKGALDKLLTKSSMSDWFVMYLLSKNIEPMYYSDVIGQLTSSMMQNGHPYSTSCVSEKMDLV